ncbi:MerR family transcriptional regulator [Sneathiella sp. HT1-7]|jgi:DNA-binding transcriptional MerR regulator|uniref:MerR family transcriptional regulator n=1 Tax=Sneathiella sp. HT1-7 TaxID=2887192 RepID=UPI001D159BD2|nr:MerR family DNA-binding transcriptional regulator [Sneathiella sp. HT1-7]MCC3303519.1 MerR family DNA-binding transcriptional regulator [Sneathiella sp. HT1-7]
MNARAEIDKEGRVSFSITELAEEFGVTSRTIRFYEDKGLVNPAREGTTRIYSRKDRGRLKIILRGRRLGFSLQDIKKMLDMYSPESGSTGQLTFTLNKCEEQLEKLITQRADINEAISELEDGISQLKEHLASGDLAADGCRKTIA